MVGALYQLFKIFLIVFSIIESITLGSTLLAERGEDEIQKYAPNITPADITDACTNHIKETQISDFIQGTLASFSVTLFSELGDKTFFLAAILAMKQSRLQVFFGALLALAPMTVLSVMFGMAATVVPRLVLQTVTSLLLAFFGFSMVKEGMSMTNKDGIKEFEKCSEDVKKSDRKCLVLTQTFTLTLLGELGDRSQIATVLLATTENAYGVAFGGILGHMLCTAAAVLGGRLLAHKIPVKTMITVGGTIFFIFACTSWISW
ncbi:putative divalent cation/proton antiporter TMEM165 [Lycorma delicatula]|uniref:putative divalent cation/proton antiporter TMEM165 n=1 Tax=Lycorma delicatula TaxID=130591 RepID=UPI003F51A7E5